MQPIILRSWGIFSVVVLILGAGWMALSIPPAGTVTGGTIPAPRQGFAAPDFALPDDLGNVIRLSDLRGKPVLVNFWASWCPPCKAEMPAMQRIHQEYAEQGFVILAVNTTYQDDEAAARQFLQERGLTFPVLYDRAGGSADLYEVRALPTSFFVDSQGVIQEVVVGGPMSEALLQTQVERLLKEVR
jgi:peroxiredoxin